MAGADDDGKKKEEGARTTDSVHPLLFQSAAAFAAAAAIGFSLQTQLAGAMLGLIEGALDAGRSRKPDSGEPDMVAEKPVAEEAPAQEAPAVAKKKPAAVRKPAARKAAETAPPVARARTARDDLKKIAGIGPKLEQVLNARGIHRFADIAAWSEADMRRIDAELGVEGRIERDDWIGQAKSLAGPGKKK